MGMLGDFPRWGNVDLNHQLEVVYLIYVIGCDGIYVEC